MTVSGGTTAADMATAVTARDRRAHALQLRTSGMTLRQVAERLGVSITRAAQLIQAALDDIEAPSVAALRKLEGERLDSWERRTTKLAKSPSEEVRIKALGVLVRISELRAKIFGLCMPVKAEISGPGGTPLQIAPPATDSAGLRAFIGKNLQFFGQFIRQLEREQGLSVSEQPISDTSAIVVHGETVSEAPVSAPDICPTCGK